MRRTMVAVFAVALAGCGGGGSGGSSSPSINASSKTELEGTWVYSTGSHLTGSTCGLDYAGNPEVRTTYVFSNANVTSQDESCIILPPTINGIATGSTGNSGSFLKNPASAGTFTIGNVYLTSATDNYKELNVTSAAGTTLYTGYAMNASGTQFKLALPNASHDGSAPDKRDLVAGDIYQPGVGLVVQPIFVKQSQ